MIAQSTHKQSFPKFIRQTGSFLLILYLVSISSVFLMNQQRIHSRQERPTQLNALIWHRNTNVFPDKHVDGYKLSPIPVIISNSSMLISGHHFVNYLFKTQFHLRGDSTIFAVSHVFLVTNKYF